MAEFPGWEVFRGVSDLWYARRPLSSPPLLLRDENTTELRAQMRLKADEMADRMAGRPPLPQRPRLREAE